MKSKDLKKLNEIKEDVEGLNEICNEIYGLITKEKSQELVKSAFLIYCNFNVSQVDTLLMEARYLGYVRDDLYILLIELFLSNKDYFTEE